MRLRLSNGKNPLWEVGVMDSGRVRGGVGKFFKSYDRATEEMRRGAGEIMEMDFGTYQDAADRTMNEDLDIDDAEKMLLFGIAGETGELLNKIKKINFHGHLIGTDEIEEELGDILWYLANLTSIYGLSLEGVARNNVEKLEKRYPTGFSEEASRNRVT